MTVRKPTKRKKLGRPPLFGEVVYVRVHGEIQDKIARYAKRLGVGKPEAIRVLVAEHL